MASRTTFLLFALLLAVMARHAQGVLLQIEVKIGPIHCPKNSSTVSLDLTGSNLVVDAKVDVVVQILNVKVLLNGTIDGGGIVSIKSSVNVPFISASTITAANVAGTGVITLKRGACGLPGEGVIAGYISLLSPIGITDEEVLLPLTLRVDLKALLYVAGPAL